MGAERLPGWIRREPLSPAYVATQRLLRTERLHTVCEAARCPNRAECFARGTATFMILGDICTRACRFCAIRAGRPGPVDPEEPARVAEVARRLGLRHVVITSVARDDLADGGAEQFARSIHAVRGAIAEVVVEVLIPDFGGSAPALASVLEAGPDVLNHNVETVARLQAWVRPRAAYRRSLGLLAWAKASRPGLVTKSGVMVGLGETDAEIHDVLTDLRQAGCDLVTIGQYLTARVGHLPVQRYVSPAGFARYAAWGRALGFREVFAGPLVRSSYHAGAVLTSLRTRGGGEEGHAGSQ